MIIYTYGGGDILYQIFQGVAKLHSGSVLKQLFAIGGTIGLTLSVIRAFFSHQSAGDLVKTWFLPLVIGYGIFFMPKSQVMVKDIITQTEKSVANVPYGLALVSKLSSGLGYQITRAIESALRIPDKLSYNTTGHIFGAEHMMEIANFTWTDPTAEQNMQNFVINCITYDVMLGRYSIDNLKNKVDLWPFIRDRTSRNRGIYWSAKDGDSSPTTAYCSCRDAALKLDTHIRTEVEVKKKIFQHMPVAFQALTGISESAETLLRQQIMLHSFVGGVEHKASSLGLGHDLAVQRAYLQQHSTMMVAGGLAGKSVVITRTIFEALILVSFIFVVPMLALPMGITTFLRWAEMVAWINLWPPVYAILNFILHSAAKSRSEQLLKFQEAWTGLGGAGKGLSLATATPLANLYNDMVAYAGWASLFVPVLAYMILKGGMSSFVHIAGNMMQASQGAAGAAAQEQVTGNYSYGNVSLGNTQYNTAQMNQQGLSARFSDGYLQESTGQYDMTYTSDGSVMDQKVSHLPVNVSVGQSLSSNYQRRAESALHSAYSEGAQMNQSWDHAHREMVSFDQHMGAQSGVQSGQSLGIDTSTQHSMQTVMSTAQTFAKRYGMNESRAMTILGGMHGAATVGADKWGVGFSLAGKAGVDYSGSADKHKMIEEAMNITSSKEFSESMSQLKRFSQTTEFSEGQDMGRRLSATLSSSFDRSDSLSKSISQHLAASENYSKSATYARDNSARIDRNYNDAMWESFVQHVGGIPSKAASIYNSKEPWAKDVVDDFNVRYFQRMEHQILPQVDARVATEGGFHSATSSMAQHHDATVGRIEGPSRTSYEATRDKVKDRSELGGVGQHIHNQSKSLERTGAVEGRQAKEAFRDQDKSLQHAKTQLQEEYAESDTEWIGTKAARAANPFVNLNKTSRKD